jgi:multimeric flavodoxin WrbA
MKKICMVNGSFRGGKASSLIFLKDLAAGMRGKDLSVEFYGMKTGPAAAHPEGTFRALACADALVFAFPLYVYCLSGGFVRFLEDFRGYLASGGERNRGTRIYAIVNCGFPEPRITKEAVRVIRNFSSRTGFDYRLAVSIGCGPATAMTRKLPFLNSKLKRAWARIIEDILDSNAGHTEDLLVEPAIPKSILLRVKESYERKSGIL